MAEYLEGGRDGIYKKDGFIYRPSGPWTESIEPFLIYLHKHGFDCVPYPYGVDDQGIEKLSFVEGKVHNGILSEEVRRDETLVVVAKMMREFHDLGSQYISGLSGEEQWMLKAEGPIETMCHGDFAPYNIAFNGEEVAGIIDFDTLHPGPRMWDLGYALYRWIPLMAADNPECFGDEDGKKRRLKLFLETYGMQDMTMKEILDWVIKRLDYLIDFMVEEANRGNETVNGHIEDGHLSTYRKDRAYVITLMTKWL